jgi:hypothetical protein
LEQGAELQQIRQKVFDLYFISIDRSKAPITFDQFWLDFLIIQSCSELNLTNFYESFRKNLIIG